jgi:creatinine amidohydrolase/Fe(II)-dependent formamide hydrolase-like protein
MTSKAETKAMVAKSKEQGIREIIDGDYFKHQVKKLLPKTMTPDRFVRVALNALMKTPKLMECSKESLLKCMLDLSSTGLEPDGRHAHLIPYGKTNHHEEISGTISIDPQTLSQLVYEIGMSAVRHGITKLVIINGHGGNGPALHFAAQMINRDAHILTCVDTGETSDPDIDAMAETPNDVHAGEIETSTTLATRPELVRLDRAKESIPKFSSRYLDFTSKRSVGWYAYTSKISRTGVLGDPTKATREKGERMWEVMIKRLIEFVEDLKNLSLDEIFQRRY